MTVEELIKMLERYPKDMTVAVNFNVCRDRKEHKEHSEISIKKLTWTDDNYPFNEEDFDYLNLE